MDTSEPVRPNVKRTYGSKAARSDETRPSMRSKNDDRVLPPNKRSRLASPACAEPAATSAVPPSSSISLVSCDDSNIATSPRLATSSSPVAIPRKSTNSALPGRRAKDTTKPSRTSSKSVKSAKDTKLEQMHLAISSRPISKTCSLCSMSYIRGSIEDQALHKSYCRKMSRGIEWPFDDNQPDCSVLAKNIWLGKGADRLEGKIVSVEGRATGALAKKLVEIANTVNHAMGAASLDEEEARSSKYLLLLSSTQTTPQRVVGCAIVSRIKEAYRAVETSFGAIQEGCLCFGEDDGAIFCSPQPVPAMLGIHRIWTAPTHRQLGIAQRLLDAAAKHSVYGCWFTQEERKDSIAFSQPSRAGKRLFAAWTGTSAFLVFAD